MKELANLGAWIGARMGTGLSREQEARFLFALEMQCRIVVMNVTQRFSIFWVTFAHEGGCFLLVGNIGRRQLSSQWNPEGSCGADQVEFPVIPPAMIDRFGLVGFGVNRGLWHYTGSHQ